MEALTYASDTIEAVVLPDAGARLHRLRVFGHDLLRTPNDPALHRADPFFWGAYVMAPWCNRLEAQPIRVGSRLLDLPSNFPDGSAIHGQVYAQPWQVREDGRLAIYGGGNEWPWHYQVELRLTVSGSELRLELRLTNHDREPMPGGLGIHPWFRRPLRAAIHAADVFEDNLRTDARPQPVAGRLDLRVLTTMPMGLDATWAHVADPAVELLWPARVRAFMHVEAPDAFIVAASPPSLGAIAVEPQTHAPQGLRRMLSGEPGALALLEPHAHLSLTVRLAFEELGHIGPGTPCATVSGIVSTSL